MKINNKMQKYVHKIKSHIDISNDLIGIMDSGFVTEDGCCYILALRDGVGSISRLSLSDCIDRELFVNSLHLEDYVENDIVGVAIAFMKLVLWKWSSISSDNMRGVLSVNDEACVVKFFLSRGDDLFLEGLDEYIDAILVLESQDMI